MVRQRGWIPRRASHPFQSVRARVAAAYVQETESPAPQCLVPVPRPRLPLEVVRQDPRVTSPLFSIVSPSQSVPTTKPYGRKTGGHGTVSGRVWSNRRGEARNPENCEVGRRAGVYRGLCGATSPPRNPAPFPPLYSWYTTKTIGDFRDLSQSPSFFHG